MIVLSRPGIQVVCGTVTRASDCFFLISDNSSKIKIHAKTNFAIKPGMFVIASVKPVMNGETSAYTARFSGSFDFDARGSAKEEHVFCGIVMENTPLRDGGAKIVVSWKKNGGAEKRLLYAPRSVMEGAKISNKAVFVTGPGKKCRSGTMAYVVKKVF